MAPQISELMSDYQACAVSQALYVALKIGLARRKALAFMQPIPVEKTDNKNN